MSDILHGTEGGRTTITTSADRRFRTLARYWRCSWHIRLARPFALSLSVEKFAFDERRRHSRMKEVRFAIREGAHMKEPGVIVTGGCFCGAIRYRGTVAPRSSVICHCQTCRHVTGALLVPWVTFPRKDFSFVSGAPARLESSSAVVRTFCSACGTALTYESARSDDEIDVTTCTLDDPNAFPPTHHCWVSHDLSWFNLRDDLPAYPQASEDGTPL